MLNRGGDLRKTQVDSHPECAQSDEYFHLAFPYVALRFQSLLLLEDEPESLLLLESLDELDESDDEPLSHDEEAPAPPDSPPLPENAGVSSTGAEWPTFDEKPPPSA